MFAKRNILIFMLIFLFLTPNRSNAMSIGLAAVVGTIGFSVGFLGVWNLMNRAEAAGINNLTAQVNNVSQSNQEIKKDAEEIKGDVKELKTQAGTIEANTKNIDQKVAGLQQQVTGFEKKTDEGLQDVRAEISVTKVEILDQLVKKEDELGALVKNTEGSLKKDYTEKHQRVVKEFDDIKELVRLSATKEGLKDLHDLANSISVRLENLEKEICRNIQELERRTNANFEKVQLKMEESSTQQKIYFKEQLDSQVKLNNEKFETLKKFFEKIEIESREIKENMLENNKSVRNLETKTNRIDNTVTEIKRIVSGGFAASGATKN